MPTTQDVFEPKVGFKATLYGALAAVSMSSEATTFDGAAGTFQITDEDKRIIDMNTALTVTAVVTDVEYDVIFDTSYGRDGVNNLEGTFKIANDPAAVDPPEISHYTVTVGGKYISSQKIAEGRNWSINPDAALIDTSRFGSTSREYITGIETWSGSFESMYVNPYWLDQHRAKELFYVRFYTDEDEETGVHGFVRIPSLAINAGFDGAIEQTVNFQGNWEYRTFDYGD